MAIDVFISHITQERDMALILQDAINRIFEDRVNTFVSSDDAISLPIGEDFIHNIESAIQECKIALILLSKRSESRKWINLEAGALWMRKLCDPSFPVVPVCHSNYHIDDLELPLKTWQAISIHNPRDLEHIVRSISQKVPNAGIPCTTFDMPDLVRRIINKENEYTVLDDLKAILQLARFANPDEYIRNIQTHKISSERLINLCITQQNFLEIQKIIQKNPAIQSNITFQSNGHLTLYGGSALYQGPMVRKIMKINNTGIQATLGFI